MGNQAPARAIVLGASPKRWRFSNKAVRAYREAGYDVLPVHPHHREIEGLATYPTIDELPGTADVLLLYVRAEIGRRHLAAAAAKGVRTVYMNPGAGSPELAEEARRLGMEPLDACAIVAIGRSPAEFPES